MTAHAILTTVSDRPGMLYGITRVLADHSADIKYVDIHPAASQSEIYLEFTLDEGGIGTVLDDLRTVPGVARAEETPTFARIYGKRITSAEEEPCEYRSY
jgi:energy-converting hydrogenase B subunit Q